MPPLALGHQMALSLPEYSILKISGFLVWADAIDEALVALEHGGYIALPVEREGKMMMMKVRLFMIVFKNYSRLGACMHTANHPEGDTPRDH